MRFYRGLRTASFLHSAVYVGLLVVWLTPGLHDAEFVLGMTHGLAWIAMTALSFLALARRVIPFSLAVLISVGGAVGPFVGSAGFVILERRGIAGRPSTRETVSTRR